MPDARSRALRDAGTRVRRALLQFVALLFVATAAWLFVALVARPLFPELRLEWIVYLEDAIVVVAALFAIRLVSRTIRTYAVPRTSPAVGSTLQLVFSIVAYSALLFGLFSLLGVNLSSALLGAGFLGIVLGLAGQTVIGNILAALALHAARPFEVGERITFVLNSYGLQWQTYPHEALPAGYSGRVREIALFYTVIDADDGSVMHVANGQMIQALILNRSRAKARRVRVLVSVDPKVPPARFLALAGPKLSDVPGLLSPGAPQLRVVGSSGTTYDVTVVAELRPDTEEEVFRSEVLQRLIPLAQGAGSDEEVAAPGKTFPPPA